MQSKTQFIAGLFVMALCGFVVGGIDLYKVIEFEQYSQSATMQLADPEKEVVTFTDSLSSRTLDVVYVSDSENVVVPSKFVPDEIADRVIAGEGVSITFLTNRPERVFYYGQRPQVPWGWLIAGIVALAFAIYALRLRKREVAA